MLNFDPKDVETPAYVCDLGRLRENVSLLDDVQRRSGGRVLVALKGFAMWSVFPWIRGVLSGAAASSPDEARLAREELGGEVHVYAPAYSESDVRQVVQYADHIVFNSLGQWHRFRNLIESAPRVIRPALRVNPEHSEVEVPLYDPCAPRSRLGTTLEQLETGSLEGLTGLHFHTLCEKDSDALERTLDAVETRFGKYFNQLSWLNFGGGHHITRPGYDVDRLVHAISRIRERYGLTVYLEPGEAVALNTGVLVASVLDVVDNGGRIAILDTSATAHMPDVLEMPYRPHIIGAGHPGELPYTVRLGGLTCLAGDVIGDYSFERPLEVGDRVVFTDMIHYTMVKNTTFNGVRLPSIATYEPRTGSLSVVRRFGYEDYRSRLS